MTLVRADETIDTHFAEASDVSSTKKHYETLLSSMKAHHKEQLSRIRQQRHTLKDHLEDVISRCARLEAAAKEYTKELIKERAEKQALQVRVEEMQTSIEQKIRDLRKRVDDPTNGAASTQILKLKTENDELHATLTEYKVIITQPKI